MSGTWSVTGSMFDEARYDHTANLLPDGRVLISGGSYEGSGDQVSSTEIFRSGARHLVADGLAGLGRSLPHRPLRWSTGECSSAADGRDDIRLLWIRRATSPIRCLALGR